MQKLLVASVIIAAFLVGCKGEETSTTPQSGPAAEAITPAKKDGGEQKSTTMEATPLMGNAEAEAHLGGKTGK